MIKCTAFALILSLSVVAQADIDGDAVNERIPVSKAELESHWQVDCAAALTRLQAAVARPSRGDHCETSAELAREIKLCGFIYQPPGDIYQPPGDNSEHPCPDYLRLTEQLGQPGNLAADCSELAAAIALQMNCVGEGR